MMLPSPLRTHGPTRPLTPAWERAVEADRDYAELIAWFAGTDPVSSRYDRARNFAWTAHTTALRLLRAANEDDESRWGKSSTSNTREQRTK